MDTRTIMASSWYQSLFPRTRLSSQRQALQEFITTQQGFRLATSVGGVLTGRGANFIIIDDPLKPDEALSDTSRKAANDWFDHTLYSRLNDKRKGCIILIMQRLHEDDLVGHVLGLEPWTVIRFPAIAEEDERHQIRTPYGIRVFERRAGEALHPAREPLEVLKHIRETQGEYNFSGQYQQNPAPLGGGLVKLDWFKTYPSADAPAKYEMTFQSWDTANKPTELSDYSVCTTWGVKDNHVYLLHVFRKRLDYPDLKRAVLDQAEAFRPEVILIEDKASGTQLIQEMVSEGMHAIQKYEPTMDKVMRMHSVTTSIENGFVHLPDKAAWLGEYLHELASFPKGKYDDQADSTSQALDWYKQQSMNQILAVVVWGKEEEARIKAGTSTLFPPPLGDFYTIPESMPCPECNGVMSQPIPGGLKCMNCGAQWPPPGARRSAPVFTRADALEGMSF
jgi:predicted phage terminase large subunit-like protein